jgi:hypothetical protein
MHLKCNRRKKDGKEHCYWSIVENRRVSGGKTVQRQVLYLGELNSSQRESWRKTIAVFDGADQEPRTVSLFPEERAPLIDDRSIVRIRLGDLQLRRPRQWGACWLALELWQQLRLDEFFAPRLGKSRKGTCWLSVLKTLVCNRLIEPSSEWKLHRDWFERSAMADLLGKDFAIAQKDTLYNCHDLLIRHKQALFGYLRERWQDLFGAQFEVLLYDLTSTYFESDPPTDAQAAPLRRFGYSRDKRSDCVQVVIALVVTPDGLPVAYEVMPGNTRDCTTLQGMLHKIESQYGKAQRIWIMDRGIPTEEQLEQMRQSDPPVLYLVGTPKGRLTRLEREFIGKPWQAVREQLEVKLHLCDGELYVLARSAGRVSKERSMRRRRLKRLWKRLAEIQRMADLSHDELLMKLGAARAEAGRAWKLVELTLPAKDQPANTFSYRLNKEKLRVVRRREGHYLLRSNLGAAQASPEQLWKFYMQLVQIEEVIKTLKGDLCLRPIHHQLDGRIEAHVFIGFVAYCLHVTLERRLRQVAGGLTPREALMKFSAVQMLDVHLPTTDGRTVMMSRYTQPEKDLLLLLRELGLELPAQPPPRIYASQSPT